MLIDFTVGNYRSFAEPQTLSLIASKDSSHPEHVVEQGSFKLLKSAAIYGSNASGKSNLVKAIVFMKHFIEISATKMNLGDTIPGLDPFRLGKEFKDKPSLFEIRLMINGTVYQYGFTVSHERVHDEWLNVKTSDGRTKKSLHRQLSLESGKTEWQLHGELKEQAIGVTEKTRDNGLFLSRAAEMNVDFVKELFIWFRRQLECFDLSNTPHILFERTALLIQNDEVFRNRVEKLIHDTDVGIDHISIEGERAPFTHDIPPDIHNLFILAGRAFKSYVHLPNTNDETVRPFSIKTQHRIADTNEYIDFSLDEDESNGTQRYFSIIGPLLYVLDNGDLLVLDELECSLHPLLTEKIVQLFQNTEANPKGAQLIFATHDSNLMSPALFRRDQIWFTEKNQKGATELFSLADIEKQPRKHEAFEKNYLSGRYGGVPSFGPALEDFDIR